MPGVHYVLDGAELAGATNVLASGMETPNVPRRPLAVDVARYAGEWVAAGVADNRALAEDAAARGAGGYPGGWAAALGANTRARAEDAAELVGVEYEPLPFVLDGEEAYKGGVLVHPAHGSNVLLDRTFVWGEVETGL